MDIHENARLTPHGRERLAKMILGGQTPQAASEAAGVCPRTGRKWRDRFEQEGLAGLQDRSSRPKRLRQPTPPEVIERIASLRRQRMPGKEIATTVGVSPATVSRVLQRLGLNKLSALEPAEPPRRYEREQPGEVEPPTIAVWPFRNLSGEPQLDHLAAGLTDEIIVTLARSQSFTVVGRSAAYAYGAGKATDLERAKRELAARYLVEGSLRKRGDTMRVTVRLAEHDNGRHLWAENFDRPLQQLLAVPEEVTDSIITTLQPRLNRAEAARARSTPREQLDALSLYVRGTIAFFSMRRSGLQEAAELARAAIARAPDYARAHSLLSVSVRALAANGGEGYATVLNAQALVAARRAVELDPDSAIALAALGSALAFTGQARDAVPYLERAIEIDPTHCPTVAVLALALVYRGRPDEAAICAERAVGLSRNDPVGGYITLFALANAELLRDRDDAAETAIRRAISLNPAYIWNRVLLANLLGLQGDKTGAGAAFADATQLFGSEKRLVEVYRTLHLPRFERRADAARMAAGLKAVGAKI